MINYKKLITEIEDLNLQFDNDDFDKIEYFYSLLLAKKEVNKEFDKAIEYLKSLDFDKEDLENHNIQFSTRKNFDYSNIQEIKETEKILSELKEKYKNIYNLFSKEFITADAKTGEIPDLPNVTTSRIYQIKK